jgi:uncharacterized membrane protein
MTAAAFAITAALCFALSYVTMALGLRMASSVNAVVTSLVASTVVSMFALLLDVPVTVSLTAISLFLLGGLIAPGLSRLTMTLGVERLGPSIAVPLQSGVRPLLAVVAGAVVLSEDVGPLRLASAVAISAGLVRLSTQVSRRAAGGRDDQPEGAHAVHGRRRSPLILTGRPSVAIAFPLLTGVLFAAADVVKKLGLDDQPDPLLGALVSQGTATVIWAGAAVIWRPLRRMVTPRSAPAWFVTSGVLIGLANIALMYALRAGDVSVVGPIAATSPLMVFALSVVFLRRIERLDLETVLSGTLVVIGTAVLALS